MTIPGEQREVLVAMGVALLLLQNVERVIRICLTFVLQKQPPLTFESLQQQGESERKQSIGYFLSELRKRASIDQRFDLLLEDFLNNRNDFVHDLSRVPAWGLSTAEQTAEAKQFVHKLIRQTEEVLKVFAGLILAWQEKVGMSEPSLPNHEWFAEIDRIYKPLADQVFSGKGT